MSCFWDTLLKNINNYQSINEFIDFLKEKNKLTRNVLWNNLKLSETQYKENFNHIKDFNKNTIQNGYDCSSCDPFLLLICELFEIEIIHHFNGTIINYKYKNPKDKKIITIHNNMGHMW